MYVSDVLQSEEAFTVDEFTHTHIHTHTQTHTFLEFGRSTWNDTHNITSLIRSSYLCLRRLAVGRSIHSRWVYTHTYTQTHKHTHTHTHTHTYVSFLNYFLNHLFTWIICFTIWIRLYISDVLAVLAILSFSYSFSVFLPNRQICVQTQQLSITWRH